MFGEAQDRESGDRGSPDFTLPNCATLSKSLNLSLWKSVSSGPQSQKLCRQNTQSSYYGSQGHSGREKKIFQTQIVTASGYIRSSKTECFFKSLKRLYLEQSVYAVFPLTHPHWPTQMKKDTKHTSGLTIACLDTTHGETPIFPLSCIPVYSC